MAEHLRTPKETAAYLDAWLTEAPADAAGIAKALGDTASRPLPYTASLRGSLPVPLSIGEQIRVKSERLAHCIPCDTVPP